MSEAPLPDDEVLEFGPFRLFPARKLLLEGDKPVSLAGRSFDLLAVLADCAGRLVSKSELTARVWPDVLVDEANLRAQVTLLHGPDQWRLGPAQRRRLP